MDGELTSQRFVHMLKKSSPQGVARVRPRSGRRSREPWVVCLGPSSKRDLTLVLVAGPTNKGKPVVRTSFVEHTASPRLELPLASLTLATPAPSLASVDRSLLHVEVVNA